MYRILNHVYMKYAFIFSVYFLGIIRGQMTSDHVILNGGMNVQSGLLAPVQQGEENQTGTNTLIVGQPFIGSQSGGGLVTTLGFWSPRLQRPGPANLTASYDIYPDRIDLEWSYDPNTPPPTTVHKIYREGALIRNNYTIDNVSYIDNSPDLNTGSEYSYILKGANSFGLSDNPGTVIGKTSTVGSIAGNIATSLGTKILNAKVKLTPNWGNSIFLDGIDDYITIPDGVEFDFMDNTNLPNAMMDLWIRPTDIFQDAVIFSKGDHYVGLSSTVGFQYLTFIVNGSILFTSDDVIPVDEWTHITLYKETSSSGTSVKLFLNGEPSAFNSGYYTITLNDAGDNSNDLVFGKDDNGNHFRGNIDEFRTWDTAHDTASIRKDHERYMYYITLGNINYEDLTSLFQMNEGSGSTITNAVNQEKNGEISGSGVDTWSTSIPPSYAIDYTDLDGNYQVNNINYGTGTNYSVTPSKPSHEFSPSNQSITLLDATPTANGVNFAVTNLMSVSGYVTFSTDNTNGEECGEKDVQILVDGEFTGVMTDENGFYRIEVEPGLDTLTIKPYRIDRSNNDEDYFSPIQLSFSNIITPKTGNFIDSFSRTLRGVVGGGSCQVPLGPYTMSDVVATAANGCFGITANVDAGGNYVFYNLPPLEYQLAVDVDVTTSGVQNIQEIYQHFQGSGVSHNMSDSFNMQDSTWAGEGDTIDFTYFAPITVDFVGGLTFQNQLDDQMFRWGIKDTVDIYVYEPYYNNGECPLDTGYIKVRDYIADKYTGADSDTLEIKISKADSGHVYYTIKPGLPNLSGDGPNPYKKRFEVLVSDTSEIRQATEFDYAVVLGYVARNVDFTTVTSEMPFMILRRPPGDQSVSSWMESQSQTTGFSVSTETSMGLTQSFSTKIGVKQEILTAPLGIGTSFETESGVTLTNETSLTGSVSTEYETSLTIERSTALETAPYDGVLNGNDFDVFVGGALNILYGVSDELKYSQDDNGNWVYSIEANVIVIPDGFATTFIYSRNYINEELIPELTMLSEYYQDINADSAYFYEKNKENWQKVLAREDTLRNITAFPDNYSFDGAAGPYSVTSSKTSSESMNWGGAFEFSNDFKAEYGMEIFGMGFDASTTVSLATTVGRNNNSTEESTTEVSFTLDDDDETDDFTVDVGYDPIYGTPVFRVQSATTSCPYEEWVGPEGTVVTTPADEPYMEWLTPSTATNVLPDDIAQFKVLLRNESPSQETRTYELSFVSASNPLGAIIKINGTQNNVIPFTLEYLESDSAIITVERPDGSNNYEYDDLRIKFAPPCETNYAGVTIGYTLPFEVNFARPCSNVDIYDPTDDFVVNTSYDDTLYFTITNYEMNQSYFDSIQLQYRPLGEQNWYTFTEVNGIDSLQDNNIGTTVTYWDLSSLEDGVYDVRAKSLCLGGILQTNMQPIRGIVDRIIPEALGLPEPTDGVLNITDELAVNFTENIDPVSLTPLDVTITDPTLGEITSLDVDVSESRAVITIQVPNSTIENHYLSATINKYNDLYGNQGDSISWTFQVNRNPIGWNQEEIEVISIIGEETSFDMNLLNIGSSARQFNLVDVDPWITATPEQGEINPGGQFTIHFEIDDNLNVGEYENQLHAHTADGDEPLNVNVISMCQYPEWVFDVTDYLFSMNMTLELAIKGTASEDVYDRIWAFSGDECRGFTNIVYDETMDRYLAYLTVYSNTYSGEDIQFHVWDRTGCVEYWQTDTSFAFLDGAIHGSPTNPLMVNATGEISQDIAYPDGFYWFSMNVDSDINDELNTLFDGLSFDAGDRIISHEDGFAIYSDVTSSWSGTLTELELGKGYIADFSNENLLHYIGLEVWPDTVEIPVHGGWTWLGYLPNRNMNVNVSLASLTPSTEDLIKDQTAFAQYIPQYGWIGSMDRMFPNRGYKLKLTNPDTLTYPNPNSLRFLGEAEEELFEFPEDSLPSDPWVLQDEYKYPNTMNVIALIESDTFGLNDSYDMVAALVNGEVHGTARPVYVPQLDAHRVFLTIAGDGSGEEMIELRIWDNDEEKIYKGSELLDFAIDDIIGNILQPLIIEKTALGIFEDGYIPEEFFLAQNYPNPFNPITRIGIGIPEDGFVNVRIYNILGHEIRTLISGELKAGYHNLIWNAKDNSGRDLASGVYFVVMEGQSFRDVKKMMILK